MPAQRNYTCSDWTIWKEIKTTEYSEVWNKGTKFGEQRRATSKGFECCKRHLNSNSKLKVCTALD